MTIKSSGSLAMSEINAEFGLGNSLSAYKGVLYWLNNGTSGNFSSGAISIGDFYNKNKNRPSYSIEYLVVGGGGGGGCGTQDNIGGGGGGGGGGQYVSGSSILYVGANNSVTIGGGGIGGYIGVVGQLKDGYGNPYNVNGYVQGGVGGTSSLSITAATINAVGGNPGLARWYNPQSNNYNNVQWSTPYFGGSGGAGNAGGGYNAQGGSDGVRAAGGGGGVDDANGSGHGGAGPLWLNGARYSGGGGGGADYTSGGNGGAGGGGKGASGTAGFVGTANTGGGGGGGGSNYQSSGLAGGSGVVIIRYPGSSARFTGGSVSVAGGYVYHTFTGSTSFTS